MYDTVNLERQLELITLICGQDEMEIKKVDCKTHVTQLCD